MDKDISYSILLNALWTENSELLDQIYHYIVKEKLTDRNILIRMMKYTYSMMYEDKYLNLLKVFSPAAQSKSEIAYFVSFYFLMKNSPYHAFMCFKTVKRDESPYYYELAKHNIKFLQNTNSKITDMVKKSLKKALKEDPDNISLKEQLDNLLNIENEVTKTVREMIEFTQKDNYQGQNNFNTRL